MTKKQVRSYTWRLLLFFGMSWLTFMDAITPSEHDFMPDWLTAGAFLMYFSFFVFTFVLMAMEVDDASKR